MNNQSDTRRKYTKLTEEMVGQVQRLLQTNSIAEINYMIQLSKSRVYEIKIYLETAIGQVSFNNFKLKNGRKQEDFSYETARIRESISNDNALTQIGVSKPT